MNELLTLTAAVVAGGVLGAMFFGGLWWTIQKGKASNHPGALVLGQPGAADEHCPGWILRCFRRSLGAAGGVSSRICHRPGHRDADVR